MTTLFHARPYSRFIEIKSNLRTKKFHRTNLGSNFLGGSFNNRNCVRATIWFRRERQPQNLKRLFFLKNRPIHFHINSTSVIRPVKQNKLSFSNIEIKCRRVCLSSSKQKLQFSQNKSIWYKTMLPLQNLLLYWPFWQRKCLISNRMSKIADLTCKIMRKFRFPTYSSFYLKL